MKERMKKVTLLTFHHDKNRVTDKLHDLGVLHIEGSKMDTNSKIESLSVELQGWKKALTILQEMENDHLIRAPKVKLDIGNYRDEILKLDQQRPLLVKQISELDSKAKQIESWGEFDWSKIKILEDHQVGIRFYSALKKEFEDYDFNNSLPFVIFQKSKLVWFILVSYKTAEEPPFEKIILPKTSLKEIEKQRLTAEQELQKTHSEISGLIAVIPKIQENILTIEDQISNAIARNTFEQKAMGKIEVIKGWFPEKSEADLLKFINENEISFEFSNPEPGDKTPVILKNKKYPKVFEPITKIFQLPDYYEFDLTPFIAVFFPIFFAYCLGDAGYGLILLIISAISFYTFFKKLKGIAILIGFLGAVTTILGILKSGTVFGIPITQHENIAFFHFLSKYVVITDNQEFIFNAFNVALMIGIVQIIIAIFISIGKKIYFEGLIESFSAIGKLMIVTSIIVLFLGGLQNMAFFTPYLLAAKIVLVAGIILVLFFHNTLLPVAQRLGSGILPLYFIFTGLLGDVLSYIRLFALGVASSILGLVVNQIGSQMMEGSGVFGISLAILFLVVGHCLNFLLACLGAFVHPLRLTFVEFYNNANFTGGGIRYTPFKKHSTT